MTDLVADVDPSRDHVLGPVEARVTLVEYADFECPSCREARGDVDAARAALGDDLRVVFRHLPVPNAHPHAVGAALVAEAAGEQGAFWEMHDRLFDHQDQLGRSDLIGHARALGLDVDRVTAALDEERHADRIEKDVDTALRSGVTGTPGFFVDGWIVDAGWADGALADAVRDAAARHGGSA